MELNPEFKLPHQPRLGVLKKDTNGSITDEQVSKSANWAQDLPYNELLEYHQNALIARIAAVAERAGDPGPNYFQPLKSWRHQHAKEWFSLITAVGVIPVLCVCDEAGLPQTTQAPRQIFDWLNALSKRVVLGVDDATELSNYTDAHVPFLRLTGVDLMEKSETLELFTKMVTAAKPLVKKYSTELIDLMYSSPSERLERLAQLHKVL